MKKKHRTIVRRRRAPLYQRVRDILESARIGVARSVNTTHVVANWLIGREIIEEEQRGQKRASYGDRLLHELAEAMQSEYRSGYGLTNLKLFRKFYLEYPSLVDIGKGLTMRDLFQLGSIPARKRKGHTACDLFPEARATSRMRGERLALSGASPNEAPAVMLYTRPGKAWGPGDFQPSLSWSHYRALLRVDQVQARSFYEIEAIKNAWAVRELEPQINSLLYERLAKSRDKAGLMKLATKGYEVRGPADIFKDPLVIEFLGLPESHRLVQSRLEQALIGNLQAFLLELGKGFAFVARQKQITLDGDHFYIDLVFYHTILKCYVLIDIKMGKLTHQDLGQLQLYVNYYDQEINTAGDNPALGLILCTDKNDAVVKYTLRVGQKIFTSRYKLHLPTESELQAEMKRELRGLSANIAMEARAAYLIANAGNK